MDTQLLHSLSVEQLVKLISQTVEKITELQLDGISEDHPVILNSLDDIDWMKERINYLVELAHEIPF